MGEWVGGCDRQYRCNKRPVSQSDSQSVRQAVRSQAVQERSHSYTAEEGEACVPRVFQQNVCWDRVVRGFVAQQLCAMLLLRGSLLMLPARLPDVAVCCAGIPTVLLFWCCAGVCLHAPQMLLSCKSSAPPPHTHTHESPSPHILQQAHQALGVTPAGAGHRAMATPTPMQMACVDIRKGMTAAKAGGCRC